MNGDNNTQNSPDEQQNQEENQLEGDQHQPESHQKEVTWQLFFIIALSLLFVITFVYYLPLRFEYQSFLNEENHGEMVEDDHGHEEDVEPHGHSDENAVMESEATAPTSDITLSILENQIESLLDEEFTFEFEHFFEEVFLELTNDDLELLTAANAIDIILESDISEDQISQLTQAIVDKNEPLEQSGVELELVDNNHGEPGHSDSDGHHNNNTPTDNPRLALALISLFFIAVLSYIVHRYLKKSEE